MSTVPGSHTMRSKQPGCGHEAVRLQNAVRSEPACVEVVQLWINRTPAVSMETIRNFGVGRQHFPCHKFHGRSGKKNPRGCQHFWEGKTVLQPKQPGNPAKWCGGNGQNPIAINEGVEFSWVKILVVLGCYLDSSGSTEAQIRGRLAQGRKMFNKLRPMLSCPKIPENERVHAFYTTVGSSVLWGSGCWTPSVCAQQLVSVQKKRWLRCILGGRKNNDLEWVEWLRQTKRTGHSLRCNLGIPALWH